MGDQLLIDVNKALIYFFGFHTLVGACLVGASSRVFEIAGNRWDPSVKSYINNGPCINRKEEVINNPSPRSVLIVVGVL